MNAPISLSLTAKQQKLVEKYRKEHGIATFEEALRAIVLSFLNGCKDTKKFLQWCKDTKQGEKRRMA